MRRELSEAARSGNDKTAPFSVDGVNGAVYINRTVYGGNALAINDSELYALGMNTDMICGFRAQMSAGRNLKVLWPEHLTGLRWTRWCQGQELALSFMKVQRKIGCAVRSDRNRDFSERGDSSVFVVRGADRKQQQLRTLEGLTGWMRMKDVEQ